jgi:hypothetical protein
MSREEAATIYLDNRLGFHGGFFEFQEAERILSEQEKRLIQMTVSGIGRTVQPAEGKEPDFFSPLIDNDNQYLKI